ncbi:hypothetical protein RclHR1_02370012 [Rhizophagus clarus]|uniref:Uncharacterized protein n=1 Tax=Rhizophagus clarus TaxID=94130 RepID=A0A2Z6R126_9GLOM|nr:hypothetical protein RclHR1_02370012 [Rhizophagus clarus]GES78470.1 hypothetical protein GLOIN_2v1656560 [Rhizophagus clarus]
MPFNERSPLISYSYDEEEEISFIQKTLTLICFVIALSIVVLIFVSPHNHSYSGLPSDISSVPYHYMLSHKSYIHFGYLIETLPIEFDDEQSEFVLLAEIVSISPWTLGNYEVHEYRKNITIDETFPVKTVDSSLSFWMNDVYISFKKDPYSFNDTDLSDVTIPELCDYKITWNWIFNGHLYRKCDFDNEESYTHISYIKGSTSWGLKFVSPDGSDIYATTSATDYWWNMHRRDVDVNPLAPFPPVIPAIYTAYYDTIQRNRENNNRRN